MLDKFAELLDANNIKVVGKGVNGQEAFEMYKKFRPDLVFLNAIMPNFDGFYGLEKIREYDHQAKVILISGSTVDKVRLNDADATEIIEKPIRIDQVLSMISNIIKY
jgi:DNA-binding response OmpR family regulator